MLEQIQDFTNNLSAEVMDVQRSARDLVGGTIAMTIIDNSPLENLINSAASSVPLSPNQQQTVAAGMTYAVARIICRTSEKVLNM